MVQKNLKDLIEELKDTYMNKLTPSIYCENIKKKQIRNVLLQ